MLLCVAGGRCVPLQEVEELIGVSNSSGDKSINTILVRPSHKGAPPSLSDHLNQKDKSFTSAWAQIMELEGYRSAAIGLDNKYDAKVSINDSDGSASKLIGESHQKYTQTYMKSSQYENECNDSDSKSCENQNIRHFEICDINLSTDCRKKDSHQTDASYPTPNKSDETSKRCVSVDTKLKPLRTRASKFHSRNRRKTLPDNSLKSPSKDLRSPEHDPNASWGRYNSRAMRDSVLKVAEKYAEIVHLRRQTRLKLDSVSEGIQLSKYSPFSSSKISDSESILNLEDKLHTKILSTTNYMPEIPTISLKKLGQMPAKDRRSDRTKFTVDLVSMDLSNDRVSNNSSRIERIKIPPSGNLEFGMFGNSYAAFSSSKCIKGSNISPAFPLSSSNKLYKKNPSIDCKIAYDKSSPAYHFTCTQELKTKLCADCAKSTNEAPPIKQPSCRSNFGFSSIPLLKPLCNEESQLNATPVSSKKPASRKCTMLSAQEMAELVHGTNSLKAEDSKVSQTKVTKIVSSWIQKQKTKRKPVFFIGDPDSCHETHVKGRISRRSLSLTSVREGEVSLHTNGGPLEDQSIKRASSICGQRGDLFRSLFRNRRKPQNCENVFANPWFRKSDSESSMIGKSNAKLQKEDAEKTSPKIFPLKQINRALSLKKKSNDQNFHVSKCHCEVKAVLKKHSFLTRSASLSWPLSKQNIQSAHPLQNKGRHLLNDDIDDKCWAINGKENWRESTRMGWKTLTENSTVEESLSFENLRIASYMSMNKDKTPIVLRRLTKATSQSERFFKRKSAFELWGHNEPKVLTSKHEAPKQRPSSQFYDLDEFSLNAEDSRIEKFSNVSSSHPTLCDSDNGSSMLQTTGTCLSLHTSTPQLSSPEGFLQRFRKSFAVRFKKKLEATSKCEVKKLLSPEGLSNQGTGIQQTTDSNYVSIKTLNKSPHFSTKDIPQKIPQISNPFNKELKPTIISKRSKRKLSFCPSGSGANINIFENSNRLSPFKGNLDGKLDMNRTPLEYTNSAENENNATNLDMALRTNPVKLCGAHSRLLICHNKGRYRLRRSVSQPVELEMTGSIHNLKESLHGSADQDNFQKSSQLSSEDEGSSESDIYHSYCCSPTDHSNTCWELSGDGNIYAEALWEHETLDSEELPFQAGDRIEVTDTSDQDWWWGTKDGLSGWFPSAFVRLYVSRGGSVLLNGQESEDIQVPFSPCKVNINNLSSEQVRANIVLEIVATERDYVKHLKDVVEGYLKQVHRRPDMFSVERIETVFGNIKEIFSFQSQFLQQLEECLDIDSPHLSQIGKAFLNHKEDFKMYSQYCNNHPLAVSELQELYCDSQYIHFFEACRLLQEMIDISLDGFLLTPIQRICKYPLQLAELLKFTDVDHPDHVPVTNALAAMKEVAELVNERKRRMECLERIAEWQNTIEGWEGPDVLDTSSLLIHCGEVTRESSSWSRDIYLFLFDHQLIYCKKDLLKRHTYAYKGRLNLDHCDIVDVEDGKDSQFAVNVKNAWKLFSKDKDKWYLFYTKTTLEKEQWLDAFKSERQIVSDDEKQAFIVTEEAKRCARLAVQNKQKPKRPRAKFTKGRRCHPDVAVTELLLDSPSAKSRSGSLPSNIHPEFAIMAGSKLGPTRKKGSGWFHFGSGKKPKS
ncbi:hypothetical protein JTE90_010839 [Oedothorax gibbosus]|uniref:Rho guanine nucleotide exchange factor 4 n=1 Tax=Oedothorax gibbosus TaxID=931172 RepID=A0AAV6V2T0_9ARAC|nr:hypothetical protein JTE90_010839 [Oedothorax gibbosus]